MIRAADVVVIGGVNGASIAYALAAKGVKVVLADKGALDERRLRLKRARQDVLHRDLATAFSGSGFKIAPAVGACLAELITEGHAKTVDIEAFSLRRFGAGPPLEGPYPYATRFDHVDPRGDA